MRGEIEAPRFAIVGEHPAHAHIAGEDPDIATHAPKGSWPKRVAGEEQAIECGEANLSNQSLATVLNSEFPVPKSSFVEGFVELRNRHQNPAGDVEPGLRMAIGKHVLIHASLPVFLNALEFECICIQPALSAF